MQNMKCVLNGDTMNILILGNMKDLQTGVYILEASRRYSSNTAAIDIRSIREEFDQNKSQEIIKEEIEDISFIPDLIIVMKGLEITLDTLKWIKNKYQNAKIVNWFFDVYLGNRKIWENESAFEMIRFYDKFFCSLKGVADKMKEEGFDNAEYLDEACSIEFHGDSYYNNWQERKYGEDVAFIGTVGLSSIHTKRIDILKHVIDNGFRTKIWGQVLGTEKHIDKKVLDACTGQSVINEKHAIVANASLVNIGIDQDNDVSLGHSARLYRIMCAGGFYMCGNVKDLDTMFKINKVDEMPTGEEDLVVYKDKDDLIKKLDFILENDNIRRQIARNGEKKVKEAHTFDNRIEEMLEVLDFEVNKNENKD